MSDYWAGTSFPTVRTLMLSAGVASNYARSKTTSAVAGTVHSAYPLSQLTDGTIATATKFTGGTVTIAVDLGSAQTPTLFALLHTNLDEGLLVTILGSNNANLSSPVVSQEVAARDPHTWLDLRGFSFAAARYWGVAITGNSRAVILGQVLVGVPVLFEGVIDPEPQQVAHFFEQRAYTVRDVLIEAKSGVRQRALQMDVTLEPTTRALLTAIYADVGASGERVFVVPDSRVHDGFWVNWPPTRPVTWENPRVQRLSLELAEEIGGSNR